MFQFILNLHRRNSLLFWWGCICFLFACTALFFILFNQFNFLGILNWVESFQVSLSAALLSWSLGWIFFHHRSIPLIKWLSWAICLSSFFENALVFYRSWIAGSFLVTADYSIIRMRVAIKIIILVTVIISTWKLYTQKKIKISQHYLTGIIMGLVLFIFFYSLDTFIWANYSFFPLVKMAGTGKPTAMWYSYYPNIFFAKTIGIHSLQIIPLLSYFVFSTQKQVRYFSILYFLTVLLLLILGLLGLHAF